MQVDSPRPRQQRAVIAALLGGAIALAPVAAWAQSRASLGERVTALEAQLQRNTGSSAQTVEQLNRIAQLEADIKALRSQLEQLQNENEQLKQRSRDQYVDLDQRLTQLEKSPPPVAANAAEALPTPVKLPAGKTGAAKPRRAAIDAAAPSPASGVESDNAAGEQQAYDAALAAVREDQYADAARRFHAFVQQYPDSALTPNAYYWMGESYYVTQNYQLALDAFKTVISRYPDSPKAAGSMLKLGYSQDGLKQREAATATLREVIARYPRTDSADQAQSRLRAISLDADR